MALSPHCGLLPHRSPGAHGHHPLQLSGALPPCEAPISGFSFPKSSCLTCNTWFFNSVSSQSCVLHLCDWAWKLPSGHQDGSGGYLTHIPSFRDQSAELSMVQCFKQLFNIFCPMLHCVQQGERESFYRRLFLMGRNKTLFCIQLEIWEPGVESGTIEVMTILNLSNSFS